MKSNYESLDEFFKNNEIQINNFLAKAAFSVIFVYPVILILTILKIFPQSSIFRLIILFIVTSTMSVVFYIANKKDPESSYNKKILLFFTNLIIFIISIEPGLQLSFMYILVPLCSSLYFDEKFTFQSILMSLFTLIVSYSIRSYIIPDEYLLLKNRTLWRLAYTAGGMIEYLIFCSACYFLSKEVKKLIINVYMHRQNVRNIQEQIIVGFSNIIEAKEGINARHIKLTTEYLRMISYKMKKNNMYTDFLTDQNIDLMVMSVPFHDIGKVTIPQNILNKTEKLTQEEFELIKYHPIASADFISKKLSVLNDPALIQIAHDMALYHHERIDGTGYPYKLKGNSIPLAARIMSAADILDTLLSKRAYKDAYSLEKAFAIINEISDKALDKDIVNVLLSCTDEVTYILRGGDISHAN